MRNPYELSLPDAHPLNNTAVHRERRKLELERGIRETFLSARRKVSMRRTRGLKRGSAESMSLSVLTVALMK
jgi:hypothetical protein